MTLVIGVGVSTTVGVVPELVVVLVDKGVGVSSKVVKFRFFLHNSADLIIHITICVIGLEI